MNRVLPWRASERDSSILRLYLIQVLWGKDLGLNQPFPLNCLTEPAELFDSGALLTNQVFPSRPPAEKVAILSYLELCRGCDRWRHCWAFAFKELIKIPSWPESPMKFITLTFYNPPQGLVSRKPTAIPRMPLVMCYWTTYWNHVVPLATECHRRETNNTEQWKPFPGPLLTFGSPLLMTAIPYECFLGHKVEGTRSTLAFLGWVDLKELFTYSGLEVETLVFSNNDVKACFLKLLYSVLESVSATVPEPRPPCWSCTLPGTTELRLTIARITRSWEKVLSGKRSHPPSPSCPQGPTGQWYPTTWRKFKSTSWAKDGNRNPAPAVVTRK